MKRNRERVGLHAGNVILGELGYRDRFVLTAIGDSVHVAARLQELTKDYDCQLVVSDIVAATASTRRRSPSTAFGLQPE